MKKENRFLLLSFISSLFLYLGFSFLPIQNWVSSLWKSNLIESSFYFILLALISFDCRKYLRKEKKDHPSFFYSVPFLLVCSSNLLYVLCFRQKVTDSFNPSVFFTSLLVRIIKVRIEELLFRVLLLQFLDSFRKDTKQKRILLIFIISLCFGLRHLVNLYGKSPLPVLEQVGYTFFLSLFLTSYTLFYSSILISILYHFLFNFLNQLIITTFFTLNTDTYYLLFSIGAGLIVLLFYLICSIIRGKGKKKNA